MLIVTKVEAKGVVHIYSKRLSEHRMIVDVWTDNHGACVVAPLQEAGRLLTAGGAFPIAPWVDKAIAELGA
jgi:hypothetical protein